MSVRSFRFATSNFKASNPTRCSSVNVYRANRTTRGIFSLPRAQERNTVKRTLRLPQQLNKRIHSWSNDFYVFFQPSLFLPTEFSELTYSFSSGSLYYLSELERAGRVIGIYGDKTLGIYASITFDSILVSISCVVYPSLTRASLKYVLYCFSSPTTISWSCCFCQSMEGYTPRRLSFVWKSASISISSVSSSFWKS